VPAVLRELDHDAWLDSGREEAEAVLTPQSSDTVVAWQVSRGLYANKTPDDETLTAPLLTRKALQPSIRRMD